MSVIEKLPKWRPMPGDADWATRKGTSERYPEMHTGPIPIEAYVSEEFFEQEREKIFKKMWLYVGRAERIPNPGDYFVQVVEAVRMHKNATYPGFIVIRGTDGKIRAFYNACQHRGTALAWDDFQGWETSHKRFLSCRFHGWVYNSEGKLVGVPDEGQFYGDFDKSCRGLREVRCDVWKDFIFINVDESPRQTLVEQLGPIAETLADFPFETMRKAGIWSAVVRCNWKVAVDAFQEGYHVSTVHAATLPFWCGEINRYSRPTTIRLYEQGNRQVTFMINPEFVPSPLEKWVRNMGSSWYAAGGGDMGKAYAGVNPENDPYFAFSLNGIFPNLIVDPFIGGFYGHEFWPIDVNTTRWIGSINFTAPTRPSDLIVAEYGKTALRDAFREDCVTLEATQVGIESGGLRDVLLSDPEAAPRHLVQTCIDIVNR